MPFQSSLYKLIPGSISRPRAVVGDESTFVTQRSLPVLEFRLKNQYGFNLNILQVGFVLGVRVFISRPIWTIRLNALLRPSILPVGARQCDTEPAASRSGEASRPTLLQASSGTTKISPCLLGSYPV